MTPQSLAGNGGQRFEKLTFKPTHFLSRQSFLDTGYGLSLPLVEVEVAKLARLAKLAKLVEVAKEVKKEVKSDWPPFMSSRCSKGCSIRFV